MSKVITFFCVIFCTSLLGQTYGPVGKEYTVLSDSPHLMLNNQWDFVFSYDYCPSFELDLALIFQSSQQNLIIEATNNPNRDPFPFYEEIDFIGNVNSILNLNYSGYDEYRVLDENRDEIFTVFLTQNLKEIDSIGLESAYFGVKEGIDFVEDTLLVCNSNYRFSAPYTVYVNFYFDGDYCKTYDTFRKYSINGGTRFENYQSFPSNLLNDGDEITIYNHKESLTILTNGFCFNPVDVEKTFIVKLDSALKPSLKLDYNDTLICPGEVLKFEMDDSKEFNYWYSKSDSTAKYIHKYSSEKDILIDRPVYNLLAKYQDTKYNCPNYTSPIKVDTGTCGYAVVKGKVFEDANFDKYKSSNEQSLSNWVVENEDNVDLTFTNTEGEYELKVPLNSKFTISAHSNSEYIAIDSVEVDFESGDWALLSKDLRVKKNVEDDYQAIITTSRLRPGFEGVINISMLHKKKGGTTLQGEIVIDDNLEIISNSEDLVFIENKVNWSEWIYNQGKKDLSIVVKVPADVSLLGTAIENSILISNSDPLSINNLAISKTIITGSYDPNDKLVFGDSGNVAIPISDSTILEYTIRFQNTGTDTAFTVRVEDSISNHLDINSLRMIDASHNYEMSIQNKRTIVWTFNDIFLVDSTTNELESHGYLKFKVHQSKTNNIGEVIPNKANIFFDFNPPVVTNTAQVIVGEDFIRENIVLTAEEINNVAENIFVFPNPVQNTLNLNTESVSNIILYDLDGTVLIKETIDGIGRINLNSINNGIYFLSIDNGSTSVIKKVIVSKN